MLGRMFMWVDMVDDESGILPRFHAAPFDGWERSECDVRGLVDSVKQGEVTVLCLGRVWKL
jgi:hypothetical protein